MYKNLEKVYVDALEDVVIPLENKLYVTKDGGKYIFNRNTGDLETLGGEGGSANEKDPIWQIEKKLYRKKDEQDKIDVTKADKSTTYTKDEVDNLNSTQDTEIAKKANISDVYKKDETYSKKGVDDRLLTKADVDKVYTKEETYSKEEINTSQTEQDDRIKALEDTVGEPIDAYTKAESDQLLAKKADIDKVYSKEEADNLLEDKANSSDLTPINKKITGIETKNTEQDTEIAKKANASDVYNKDETYSKKGVDDRVDVKADSANVYLKTETYSKEEAYSKQEVDDSQAVQDNRIKALEDGGVKPGDSYTKAETDELLTKKADVDNVYTKEEADNLLKDKANSSDLTPINEKITAIETKNTEQDASITGLINGDIQPGNSFSKEEVNELVGTKADEDEVYKKEETYSKKEVDDSQAIQDNRIKALEDAGGSGQPVDAYSKKETDDKLSLKSDKTELEPINNKVTAIEAKNTEQDTKLSALNDRTAFPARAVATTDRFDVNSNDPDVTISFDDNGFHANNEIFKIVGTTVANSDVTNKDNVIMVRGMLPISATGAITDGKVTIRCNGNDDTACVTSLEMKQDAIQFVLFNFLLTGDVASIELKIKLEHKEMVGINVSLGTVYIEKIK